MPTNKTKNRTILVTGATGHQGSAALRHLRERGFPVRALTRDPDQPKARAFTGPGIEIVRGDMEDQPSLTRAMDGVSGVYSVQQAFGENDREIRDGINVADAAKRSDIAHFVYSSVGSAERRTGIPHFESKFRIEEHIRGTGMSFTIFRPVFFMENWLGMRQTIENGTFSLPLDPSTRLQMIAVDDIGAFVAMAFEHAGKWKGRSFELAGDELSMAEVAQLFSKAAGRDVRYVQMPWDQYEKQAGKEMTLMFRWFQETGYDIDIQTVRHEYPSLTTFGRWLNSNWHTAAQTAG